MLSSPKKRAAEGEENGMELTEKVCAGTGEEAEGGKKMGYNLSCGGAFLTFQAGINL